MRLASLVLAGFMGGAASGFVLVQFTGWNPGSARPSLPVAKRAVYFDNDSRYIWKPRVAELRLNGMGINSEGFRDPLEFDQKLRAREGRRVIVIVGSSGGFSTMLNDRDTLAPVLERELAGRGMPALVFNLCQPGYSSAQGRRLFEDHAARLRPDLVITLFGYVEGMRNDVADTVQMTEPRWYGVYRRSRLRERLQKAGLIERADVRRVSVETYLDDLRAIARAARANGARRTLVLPAVEARMSEKRREYNEAATAAFPPGGDPEAFPLPGFERSDLYQDDGAHLNAAGLRKTVRALLPRILASLGQGR